MYKLKLIPVVVAAFLSGVALAAEPIVPALPMSAPAATKTPATAPTAAAPAQTLPGGVPLYGPPKDDATASVPSEAPSPSKKKRKKADAPLSPADFDRAYPRNGAPAATSFSADELYRMRVEIDELKQRTRVAEAVSTSTQKPAKAKFAGASTMYDFGEGSVYQVYGGVERVTDIRLQPGELLTANPFAGDTVRWAVSDTKSGSPGAEMVHVLIKPLDEGISTNLLIMTNRRTYTLQVVSSLEWYMPSVRWNYPLDEAAAAAANATIAQRIEKQREPVLAAPETLDFNYRISGDDVEWKPTRAFNDGSKTYLQMPITMKSSEAPALFVIEETGEPMLVNYRVKDGVYIVDRLFKKAELRVGTRLAVRLERQPLRTGFWSE